MTNSQAQHWIATFRHYKRTGRRSIPRWKLDRIERIPGWTWDSGFQIREIQEWVQIAEAEASENDGLLPSNRDLQHKWGEGLRNSMRNHPDKFRHIPQINLRSSLLERIREAERLAKENGGSLPNWGWFRKNNPNLEACIRRNPSAFSHLSRRKAVRKTIEDHTRDAELIAKQNDGCLPSTKILEQTNIPLIGAIQRKPSRFSHIPQEVRDSHKRLVGFRNGTAAQRRALEIKHGLRPSPRKRTA